MKSNKIISGDINEAINIFKQELPDPEKSRISTFKDEFYLNEKKITFIAQKLKSSNGMVWSINYTS